MVEQHWAEVGAGVYQCRYDPLDVTVGAILGDQGVTVIDTRNNAGEAQEIIDGIARQFARPIAAVINTHAHYDHTFGNQRFAQLGIPIYGHHLIPRHFENYERPQLEEVRRSPELEPAMSWDAVVLTPPSRLLDQACHVQLGGRGIELLPLEPGHTDTDLAIHVPDAGVWFVGDIIEESGPPMFGSGADPLGWPKVLESLLGRIQAHDVIVPGHGAPVGRAFVAEQARYLELLATVLESAHGRGIALAEIAFPDELQKLWPADFLAEAAKDAYATLALE